MRLALRILVADDHEIVRRGLRAVLEAQPGWEVTAEAADGNEAVEKVAQLKPDIVVLDISMPELGGIEAARRILKVAPETEVLFVTMHDAEQIVCEAMDAGARGYLLKSDPARDLVAAVHCVGRHKVFLSARIASIARVGARQRRGMRVGQGKPSFDPLTAREREILHLLAEGKSPKEIAIALDIKVKTAETHRTNIMRKLDLHSTANLVRYAIRNRIVEE